jgi:hypothetical protein
MNAQNIEEMSLSVRLRMYLNLHRGAHAATFWVYQSQALTSYALPCHLSIPLLEFLQCICFGTSGTSKAIYF